MSETTKTVKDIGREAARFALRELAGSDPTWTRPAAEPWPEIPEGDYLWMRDRGVDPDPAAYWRAFNAVLAADPDCTLLNPWTGAASAVLKWAQVRAWAHRHVHEGDRQAWLRRARRARDREDWRTLGAMILGS